MAIGLNHNTEITRPGEEIFLQVGSIFSNGRSTPPSGYLLCDGSAVSRIDFNRLFEAIGTIYGVGNGTTTFNIPDMRGVVPRGAGTSVGYTSNSTIVLGIKTDDAGQDHKHNDNGHSHGDNGHTHYERHWQDTGNDPLYSTPNGDAAGQLVGNTTGVGYASIATNYANISAPTTNTQGAPRTANETRVKSLGVNFFIKY